MKAWKAIKENIGFAGALIGILWWLGVTPEMVGEQVYAVSYAVLPFVMIASGILIGWNAKKWQATKRAPGRTGTDDCIRPARWHAEPSSDALADLLPLEREMISRLYNEVQVYVGMDGLAAARSLRERGAVIRTDAPESGVISQCYVQLTDEWRGIVKAAMTDGSIPVSLPDQR